MAITSVLEFLLPMSLQTLDILQDILMFTWMAGLQDNLSFVFKLYVSISETECHFILSHL
jgi:hypothetical protein